jgi:hypothetical protein
MTHTEPEIEVIEITPDLAREWVGHNTHNRKTRQRVVLAYAADMAAGDWAWNGEGIKFDVNGVLLDGQHRLLAIIESGVTVRMPVFRGLPPETQETMDGGVTRKFSDVLTLRGERDAHVLAAITRKIALWENGLRLGGGSRLSGGSFAPTNAQLLQVIEKYPDLRSIARSSATAATKCALPSSVIGLCWWLFSALDNEDCEHFWSRVADDQHHSKGDPAYELRRVAAASKDVRGSRSVAFLTAVTIKAWNAFRDGRTIGVLKFRPGGANPETFPEPH